MRKLMVVLALISFMSSVPVAFATDLNRNGMRQIWAEQQNLEKQRARVWGLGQITTQVPAAETTQQIRVGKPLVASDRF